MEEGRKKDINLVKQILMRKLSSLVLKLYCQAVRFSEGSACLVSASWAELSSWCAQMSHQSSLLPVRRELAEHCAGSTPALLWQPQPAGLRPLDQDPRSCHMKVSCTHGPTGQDCQKPPEHYCSGSRRIRRNGKKEGRKKQTGWNGREKLKQMLIILKSIV